MLSSLYLPFLLLLLAALGQSQDTAEPSQQLWGEIEGQDPNRKFEIASGRYLDVFATWHSERSGNQIAAGCGKFAEEVLEAVMARFDLRVPTADGQPERLLVNLYRRPKELGSVLTSLGLDGKGLGAYHSPGYPEVHVAVQPGISDLVFKEFGIPAWLLSEVAEAVVLAWVDWAEPELRAGKQGPLLEGFLLSAIHQALVKRGLALEDLAENPNLSVELAALQAACTETEPDQSLADLAWWELPLDHPLGRAARRLLANGFFRSNSDFSQAPRASWDLQALPNLNQILKQTASRPVPWDLETGLVASIGDQAWLQTSKGLDSARCWFPQPIGSENYAIEGSVSMHLSLQRAGKSARSGSQMNLLLGGTPDGYVLVTFGTRSGVVVFEVEVEQSGDRYRKLLEQSNGVVIAAGVPVNFRVEVGPELGIVALDGRVIGTFTTKHRDVSGQVGFGAQGQRGIGVWSDLRVLPLPVAEDSSDSDD